MSNGNGTGTVTVRWQSISTGNYGYRYRVGLENGERMVNIPTPTHTLGRVQYCNSECRIAQNTRNNIDQQTKDCPHFPPNNMTRFLLQVHALAFVALASITASEANATVQNATWPNATWPAHIQWLIPQCALVGEEVVAWFIVPDFTGNLSFQFSHDWGDNSNVNGEVRESHVVKLRTDAHGGLVAVPGVIGFDRCDLEG